jgi:hypothetical protein
MEVDALSELRTLQSQVRGFARERRDMHQEAFRRANDGARLTG